MPKISSTSIGASPIEGSSSSISFGCVIRARPIATICCSPPEVMPAGVCAPQLQARETTHRRSRALRASARATGRRTNPPASRFSSTVRCGKQRRPSSTWTTPRRPAWPHRAANAAPAQADGHPARPRPARPDQGRDAFSVVVLPAPLAPSRATMLPSATASETPRSARSRPAIDDMDIVDQKHRRGFKHALPMLVVLGKRALRHRQGAGVLRGVSRRWCRRWWRRAMPFSLA